MAKKEERTKKEKQRSAMREEMQVKSMSVVVCVCRRVAELLMGLGGPGSQAGSLSSHLLGGRSRCSASPAGFWRQRSEWRRLAGWLAGLLAGLAGTWMGRWALGERRRASKEGPGCVNGASYTRRGGRGWAYWSTSLLS